MREKISENPFRTPFSDIFSPITIERLIIPKTSIGVGVLSVGIHVSSLGELGRFLRIFTGTSRYTG